MAVSKAVFDAGEVRSFIPHIYFVSSLFLITHFQYQPKCRQIFIIVGSGFQKMLPAIQQKLPTFRLLKFKFSEVLHPSSNLLCHTFHIKVAEAYFLIADCFEIFTYYYLIFARYTSQRLTE